VEEKGRKGKEWSLRAQRVGLFGLLPKPLRYYLGFLIISIIVTIDSQYVQIITRTLGGLQKSSYISTYCVNATP